MPEIFIDTKLTNKFQSIPNLDARPKKNLSKRLNVVISKIFKKMLHFFSFKNKRTRFKFTARNILMTDEAARLRKTKKQAGIKKKASSSQIVRIQKIKVPVIPPPTDSVLIELSRFFDDFTKTLIDDVLYDKTIKPAISSWKPQIIEKIGSVKDNLPTVMGFLSPGSSLLENYKGFSEIFKFLEILAKKINDGEFNKYIEKITAIIDKNFEEDAKIFIDTNSKSSTAFLAAKICEIIDGLQFEDLFDKLIKNILLYTEDWIQANKIKLEYQYMIPVAENDVRFRAGIEQETTKQKKAEALLEMVKKAGNAEAYLEKEFLFGFAKQKKCHPAIKELIEKNDDDPKKAFIARFTTSLIAKVLPPIDIPYPDGSSNKVHGLFILLKQMQYPDNFLEIGSILQKMFNEVVDNSESIKNKKYFKKYFFSVSKEFITKNLESKLEKIIINKIENQLTNICSEKYMEELFAENILPTIFDKLIENWSNRVFFANLPILSTQIVDFLLDKITLDNLSDKLTSSLYGLTEEEFIDFSFEHAGVTFNHYKLCIKPMLDNYLNHLKDKFPTDGSIDFSDSKAVIGKIIELLSDKRDVKTKDAYGSLIINLLFDIGELGGVFSKAILGWFKPGISKNTSIGMQDVGGSYHFITKKAIASLQANFLNQDYLNDLFFSENQKNEAIDEKRRIKRKKMGAQISQISKICHDLIYRNLESYTGGILLKRATPESDFIEAQVNELYNRIFGESTLNESLLFNCLDDFHAAIQ